MQSLFEVVLVVHIFEMITRNIERKTPNSKSKIQTTVQNPLQNRVLNQNFLYFSFTQRRRLQRSNTSTSQASFTVTSSQTTCFWTRQDISNCQILASVPASKSRIGQTSIGNSVMRPSSSRTLRDPGVPWTPNGGPNLGKRTGDSWLTVRLARRIILLLKFFNRPGKSIQGLLLV